VQCGRPIPAFDVVARMESIEDALAGDCRMNMVDSQSGLAVAEKIQRVHAPELVDFLAQAWALGAAPRTTSICCSPTPSHIRDCTPRNRAAKRPSCRCVRTVLL
jgi:hypothetical protein